MTGTVPVTGLVTVNVAGWCMVIVVAGLATFGCPVRVGSKLNVQVVDQTGPAMKSVTCTFQLNWVMVVPATVLRVDSGTTSTAVCPDG